jgi:hypothetical protein
MANDERIGCNVGRTTIIDPNIFDGQNSSSNISVPVEDLTIAVSLTTFKKGRTILTASEKKDTLGTSESSSDIKINFIDGEEYGNERVLTTDYTDLTIDFGNQPQSLGITSIDIDFNSSYAPMIVINFIDVKGNAIFQNENNIKNNTNKYSTFFQLPYPLFELTVKGYYGRPVKYCLHLTKFNSKFNSKTGNFEITCNFVGYTYAMLSDMLIGYLKAIPYTRIGGERYKEINEKRNSSGAGNILDLNELMIKISDINNQVEKIAATDGDAAQITNIENKQSLLNTIINNINNFGSSLDYRKDEKVSKYEVIIRVKSDRNLTSEEEKIKTYKTSITENINKYNETDIKLNLETFTNLVYYHECSINNLSGVDGQSPISDKAISEYIINYIKKNKINIADDTIFDCWYLPILYIETEKSKISLDTTYRTAKENLAITIKDKIKDYIGFDPTIRNIVEIFTTAIEVFMETIFLVSSSAKEDIDNSRKTQLKTKFNDNKNSDLKNDDVFHPWPDYRENDVIEKSYVEKYLGSTTVLPIPKDVDEIEFIEDLLNAFLIAKTKEDEAENIINTTEKNWFPVNPLDTRVMGIDITPYGRITGISKEEATKVMVIRGMTFLGYTNRLLDKKEIEIMAENEYNSLLENIADNAEKTVTASLGGLTLNDFKNAKGIVNKISKKVVVDLGNEIEYRFITPEAVGQSITESVVSILPISDYTETEWLTSTANLKTLSNSVKFLTNYSKMYEEISYNPDDGGQYIKIISTNEYETSIKTLPSTSGDTESKPLVLSNLKETIDTPSKAISAGFNAFGGQYGIQYFKDLDYSGGEEGLTVAPLKYVFYKDKTSSKIDATVAAYEMNYLSLNRVSSGIVKSESAISDNFKTISIRGIINERLLFLKYGENRFLLSTNDINTAIPFTNVNIIDNGIILDKELNYLSLFGSRFFYGQKTNEARALLFLNTLPFNGVFLEKNEIKNLFQIRGGFINAPRLWCAYIGGLLLRRDKNTEDIIRWTYTSNNKSYPLLPSSTENYKNPKVTEFINKLYVNTTASDVKYTKMNEIFEWMPRQAKLEFIRIFNEFCSSDIWKKIYNKSIIVENVSLNGFDDAFREIKNIVNKGTETLSQQNLKDAGFINLDSYYIMTPVKENIENTIENPGTMFLENNTGQGTISTDIVNLIKEEVIISNNYPYFWTDFNISEYRNDRPYRPIKVSEDNFNLYFNKLTSLFNDKANSLTPVAIKKENEQEIFGTSDEDVIKLILYRYCKNIYDKWLGGVDSIDNIIFQCGQDTIDKKIRNNTDYEIANYYRKGDKPRLIDSFRFVDRSFSDIGDKFYINPLPVNEFLINNPNSSFYGSITSILASNNFDFVSLPSFINFNDPKQVESLFKPYPKFEESIEGGDCGPSFVSVYVGQKSKHLDFKDSNYQNDGVDFQCDENNQLITDIPEDFKSNKEKREDSVAVFSVNYSQQNQNIFKDIILDQSEFSETDESLRITNDIANKGTENNRTLAGQNIFNVYSVRSYNAQVDMMGNAMIQPMMYFQLNNIPMFHGGYMITRVKHSIIPNNMSTSFTGVRIRYPKTKLLEGADFYMNMLDSMNLGSGTSAISSSSSVPPIVATIIDNGGLNGKIDAGNIKTGKIDFGKIKGIIDTFKISGTEKGVLLKEAIEPLYLMLTNWVKWMQDEGFKGVKGKPGYYAGLNSAFRTIENQQDISENNNNKSGTVAPVGTSTHGWGIAIDLQFYTREGDTINLYQNNSPNNEVGFNFNVNESLVWLLNNSYKYGWIIPQKLRDNFNTDEFWHFEYHGKSAICLLDQQKVVKGKGGSADIVINTKNPYKDVVTNPSLPGTTIKEATYSTCDFVYIKNRGDGIPENTQVKNVSGSNNQLETKNFFKNQNLTKEQTAGIMGNIHHETGSKWNPDATNKKDRNGYPSVGLIQWNGLYTPKGGSKDASVTLATIGTTVQEQLTYLTKTNDYKGWLKKVQNEKDVDLIAFWFANIVERCHLCGSAYKINTQSTYNKSYQYPRSKYAIDFNNRFNDKNDVLYWDK